MATPISGPEYWKEQGASDRVSCLACALLFSVPNPDYSFSFIKDSEDEGGGDFLKSYISSLKNARSIDDLKDCIKRGSNEFDARGHT